MKAIRWAAVLFLCIAAGGYWYASPFIAIKQARSAAATGDADIVGPYVGGSLNPRLVAPLLAAGRPVETLSSAGPAKWLIDRPTMDKVIAYPDYQTEMPPQMRDRFVFERSGFASWKFTEFRPQGVR